MVFTVSAPTTEHIWDELQREIWILDLLKNKKNIQISKQEHRPNFRKITSKSKRSIEAVMQVKKLQPYTGICFCQRVGVLSSPKRVLKEQVFSEFEMLFSQSNLQTPTSSEKLSLCKIRLVYSSLHFDHDLLAWRLFHFRRSSLWKSRMISVSLNPINDLGLLYYGGRTILKNGHHVECSYKISSNWSC